MLNAPNEHRDRVAVFVDYESLYYGLLNEHGVRPFEADAVDRIRQFAADLGYIVKFDAFADFEGNEDLKTEMSRLRSKGVSPQHVMKIKEKSYTDFVMLDSIYRTTLEDPNVNIFVVVTGDGHFAPCLGYIHNRLGREVVVVGVRGTISSQLYDAASRVVELDPPGTGPGARLTAGELEKSLIRFLDEGEKRYGHISFGKSVDAFVNRGLGNRKAAVQCLSRLIEQGAVEQYECEFDGLPRKLIRLNRAHQLVMEALAG